MGDKYISSDTNSLRYHTFSNNPYAIKLLFMCE